MPAEGVEKRRHEDMLTEEETVLAVKAAASLGIEKVRLTGGEPLVKKNILSIAEKVAAAPGIRELCLTTNGIRLPQLAKPLRAAGVRRVNVSLDTLDPAKYAHITRIGDLSDALRGLEAALSAGFERVKINAVLIGGFNDDEIPALADLTRRWPVDVRFIELMPMGGDLTQGAFLPGDAVL
jgi:cyclic pyranopterin phosphate synthase